MYFAEKLLGENLTYNLPTVTLYVQSVIAECFLYENEYSLNYCRI